MIPNSRRVSFEKFKFIKYRRIDYDVNVYQVDSDGVDFEIAGFNSAIDDDFHHQPHLDAIQDLIIDKLEELKKEDEADSMHSCFDDHYL